MVGMIVIEWGGGSEGGNGVQGVRMGFREWECGQGVRREFREWECGQGVGMGFREWECGQGVGMRCGG